MPIQVFRLTPLNALVWKHSGKVTADQSVGAIARATALGDLEGVHDLIVFEPGAYADMSADDLHKIIDAAIAAFPGRYSGRVKCALVVGRINYGIAKLFCALLEQEDRIVVPAFVFVSCRHALEWLGFRNPEIDRALVDVGPGPLLDV